MVATNFEGLVGYRTLRDEGQAPLKAYDCVFGRDFQASVCIATYGMSVPSLHTDRVYRLCDMVLLRSWHLFDCVSLWLTNRLLFSIERPLTLLDST